jgi:hypothetical protein
MSSPYSHAPARRDAEPDVPLRIAVAKEEPPRHVGTIGAIAWSDLIQVAWPV